MTKSKNIITHLLYVNALIPFIGANWALKRKGGRSEQISSVIGSFVKGMHFENSCFASVSMRCWLSPTSHCGFDCYLRVLEFRLIGLVCFIRTLSSFLLLGRKQNMKE